VSQLHTVHVRINDAATGEPTPCRVRFTGPDGTYYAPFGRLTEFARDIGRDVGGNLWLPEEDKKYAYIDGTCEIALPAGQIQIEVGKGFEYTPLTEKIDVKAGQLSIRLKIERWCDLRKEGWYSGDCEVTYMTPHAALLEAAAEDVAVVNLLAKATFQYSSEESAYPAIPNIDAFSGQKPALEMPGHMVVVNTLNWHKYFGALRLLNCHRVVYPLYFGSPLGTENWSVSAWCDQCHRKGGLVIGDLHYQPAECLLGKVDAAWLAPSILGDFVPEDLNEFGYRIPWASGSGKKSNCTALGQTRTYTWIGTDEPLSYKSWIEALRNGRSFVSSGPLIRFEANGVKPGQVLEIEEPGQSVHVQVEANSIVPYRDFIVYALSESQIDSSERVKPTGPLFSARIDREFRFKSSGWLVAYCDGGRHGAITSPIYVNVKGHPYTPLPRAAERLLKDIDEQREWALTSARYDIDKQRECLLAVLDQARAEILKRAGRSAESGEDHEED
jgi:hypothetical protein